MDTAGALIGPLLAFAVLATVPIGLGGYRAVFAFSLAFAVLGVLVLALAVPDLRVERGAVFARERSRPTFRLADLAQPGC